ncbi:MAG: hypothetical protein DRK00_03835 [Thermoprotei archaeon]|nr:MAG: hypothetical protein DRK00_03835 [Thermoprotei archaeon]
MSEEELLKRRMMLELQRRMLAKAAKQRVQLPDYRSIFLKNLTESGREMYRRAEKQYPTIAPKIAEAIGRLYAQGRLRGALDAGAIYGIFQELGYPIRIETRIVYKKRGKVKTISELLREK